jgi:hypothetical protein
LLRKILGSNKAQTSALAYRNLIRREAVIGGTLFGAVPAGHTREFFCLDEHTWVWHETWVDKAGVRQSRNTHYSVRPSGIVKTANGGQSYHSLSPTELKNFTNAVKQYHHKVVATLYSQPA